MSDSFVRWRRWDGDRPARGDRVLVIYSDGLCQAGTAEGAMVINDDGVYRYVEPLFWLPAGADLKGLVT